MQMTIDELINVLTEIKTVSGDVATNVDSVGLRATISTPSTYMTSNYYSIREGKRIREFSLWIDTIDEDCTQAEQS